MPRLCFFFCAPLLVIVASSFQCRRDAVPPPPSGILVFTKTAGFRHESIPAGVAALRSLGLENDFFVESTENAADFSAENLCRYAAVVFLNTTGDVLDAAQEAAFERYIQAGGGFVGVHAATDTEYDLPWYNGLVGAYFDGHPAIQNAVLTVPDRTHQATRHLGALWQRRDEWYNFRDRNPQTNVLISIDETTYTGGTMGADHPIAWYHAYDGGRAFYTAMGHTVESFSEPDFMHHLLGGVQYAMGSRAGPCAE